MIQEIVAIIDRSGSMSGKESDTIGGINTTIQELKNNKNDDTIKFSLKFFDNKEELKFRSANIDDIEPLHVTDLKPRGQTALYDAMGNTISFFMEKKLTNPESFTSCIIYVATDGFENASRIYNCETIRNLISNAKEYNIEILYLGANQDAILEAQKFGLDSSHALNYSENKQNVENAYRCLANVSTRYRSGESIEFTQAERMASQIQ